MQKVGLDRDEVSPAIRTCLNTIFFAKCPSIIWFHIHHYSHVQKKLEGLYQHYKEKTSMWQSLNFLKNINRAAKEPTGRWILDKGQMKKGASI